MTVPTTGAQDGDIFGWFRLGESRLGDEGWHIGPPGTLMFEWFRLGISRLGDERWRLY